MPDYTRPLRMQAAGRTEAAAQRLRLRRILWRRALRDGNTWKLGSPVALGAAVPQMLLLRLGLHRLAWPVGVVPALTLLAAVTSIAATRVAAALKTLHLSRN